jgi:hypothetical protein
LDCGLGARCRASRGGLMSRNYVFGDISVKLREGGKVCEARRTQRVSLPGRRATTYVAKTRFWRHKSPLAELRRARWLDRVEAIELALTSASVRLCRQLVAAPNDTMLLGPPRRATGRARAQRQRRTDAIAHRAADRLSFQRADRRQRLPRSDDSGRKLRGSVVRSKLKQGASTMRVSLCTC